MFFSGSNWISTSVLYTADYLTWKKCSVSSSLCETAAEEKICEVSGGVCQKYINGYYIEVAVCTIAGIIWLIWKYRAIMRLQSLPMSEWQVRGSRRKNKLSKNEDEPTSVIIT